MRFIGLRIYFCALKNTAGIAEFQLRIYFGQKTPQDCGEINSAAILATAITLIPSELIHTGLLQFVQVFIVNIEEIKPAKELCLLANILSC